MLKTLYVLTVGIIAVSLTSPSTPAAQPGYSGSCAGDLGTVAETFPLLGAIERGIVEAKVIARDERHVRVFLKNPGTQPINVSIPDVLAARPILAQAVNNFFNPQGPGGNSNSGSSQSGQSQAVAGPSQFSGQNNNNGIFAIPPESVREVKIKSVCLEHGKPEPNSRLKYELVEASKVGVGPELETLLAGYGRDELDAEAVQAATWHLANGKSWQDLANMSRMAAINARSSIFTQRQLQTAKRLVADAQKSVAAHKADKKSTSVAETDVGRDPNARALSAERDARESAELERAFSTINARSASIRP